MSNLIVIDCEMTGTKLSKHALINIGVSVMNLNNGMLLGQLDLIINIPKGKVWDPKVKEWMNNQIKLRPLLHTVESEKGYNYTDAMMIFKNYLLEYHNKFNGDLVIGCDHLGIDIPWINLYLSLCDYEPIHMIFGEIKHPVDICSYHQGCCKKTHKQVREFMKYNGKKFSSNVAAFKHFNIKDWCPIEYNHLAKFDSQCIALSHYKILKAIEYNNDNPVYYLWSDFPPLYPPDRRQLYNPNHL